DNWLPFKWLGFEESTQYSYQLNDINDLDSCYKGLSADYRNNKIPKATKMVSIESGGSPRAFASVFMEPLTRDGTKLAGNQKLMIGLMEESIRKGRGKIFSANDFQGNIHAAAFIVWDNHRAYLLLNGDDPKFRSSGASIYLQWKILEFVSTELKRKDFDFLGSMLPMVESVRRSFGATQHKYSHVFKRSGMFRFVEGARNLVR
ncbi:MAG: GNAT family N-acetyltransferase, partial [Saprospiraceae bacterium]|nr:GNAT family N-acetyltransferase [Saprospiraceae bacterium]